MMSSENRFTLFGIMLWEENMTDMKKRPTAGSKPVGHARIGSFRRGQGPRRVQA